MLAFERSSLNKAHMTGVTCVMSVKVKVKDVGLNEAIGPSLA